MSIYNEELEIFKLEANELLETAERSLLRLDAGDLLDSHYEVLLSSINALCGGADLIGFPKLKTYTQSLAAILLKLKKDPSQVKSIVSQLLLGVDECRRLLNNIELEGSARIPKVENKTKFTAEIANAPIGKILVLDDEPEIVDLICALLESENISAMGITSTNDVDQALEKFKPDVLFTDISMPNMTGVQVLEKVSKSHPFMPVVFISGHVNKNILLDAVHLGVFAVIEKPFDEIRIIECGINAIQKHKLTRMTSKSINLLLYQFNDLTEYLESQGKGDIGRIIKNEILALAQQRREINKIGFKKNSR